MKNIPQMVVKNGDLLWQNSSKKPLNKQTGNTIVSLENLISILRSLSTVDGDIFPANQKKTDGCLPLPWFYQKRQPVVPQLDSKVQTLRFTFRGVTSRHT